MRRTVFLFALAAGLALTALLYARSRGHVANQDQRPQQAQVDLVIALDTSGSMSGLIDAARQKLWDIVNEVGRAQPTPRLRVGLLTYGSGGTEEDGYVIVQSDLTDDLDRINAKLFELSTNGGTEYVARVVYRAINELNWNRNPSTLRQIYVAGNEPADQDHVVSVPQALALATSKGIFVNAIYCGNEGSSEAAGWRSVAQLGDGMYAAIDHNHGTVALHTPYDDRLNALSARLNGTYVGYGAQAPAAAARQSAQDSLARGIHAGTGASRALAKVSSLYRNSGWDLVDAKKDGKLGSISKEALPAPLQEMSAPELEKFVASKAAERASIAGEIRSLSQQRDVYLAAEMKHKGLSGDKAFDTAVKRALLKQAAKKHIALK